VAVIYILGLREFRRYWRSRGQIVATLAHPIIYLVVLGFGLGPVFRASGQGSYITFVSPGVVGMAILMNSMFSGLGMLWDRQFGFLKETLVAPVPRALIVFGRILGSAAVALTQGLFVLAASFIVGFRPAPSALPVALVFMMLISVTFSALGAIIGSVLRDQRGYQPVVNFVILPLYFLSGAFFPLGSLPAGLALATRLDPLTYGIDGLRSVLSAGPHFAFVADLAVLTSAAGVFLMGAAYSFSRVRA
jgi:ABC-2 type transport system permease protein